MSGGHKSSVGAGLPRPLPIYRPFPVVRYRILLGICMISRADKSAVGAVNRPLHWFDELVGANDPSGRPGNHSQTLVTLGYLGIFRFKLILFEQIILMIYDL